MVTMRVLTLAFTYPQ